MDKLIKRTYRISKSDDKLVKKNAKKFGGESEYIRTLIREGVIWKVTTLDGELERHANSPRPSPKHLKRPPKVRTTYK